MEKPVLGLDFGTTKVIAAWVSQDGSVKLATDEEGIAEMPSVASYQGSRGSTVLGTEARRLFSIDPKRTVVGVKRFLGRRFQSDFVGRSRSQFFYPLVEGQDGLAAVEQRGEVLPLERVAARLVARIVEHANAGLGDRFEACVVACPAHFTQRQRRALKNVIEMCGLEVRAMILEPTAAALTLPDPDQKRTLLVYDFGGGTFDTTVLRVETGVVRVLATGGDALLGGFEVDARIAAELIEVCKRDLGVDLNANPLAVHGLMDAVEHAKIELSTEQQSTIFVPFVDDKRGMLTFEHVLTRAAMEACIAPLVEKTIGIAQDTMKQAGVTAAQLDELLVVGSQTRTPYIARRVAETFARPQNPFIEPTRCVAVGAAIVGAGEQMLFDALAMPICMMSPGAAPIDILPRNTRVPATVTHLIERPPGPLLGVVFEAVESTAVDRDVLGRLMLPVDWHASHAGPYKLEASCSPAFELGFDIVDAAGERLELALEDAAKPAGANAAVQDRDCELACMVKTLTKTGASAVPMRAIRIGPAAMTLEGRAPPAGDVEIAVRRGRVIHVVLGSAAASSDGKLVQVALKPQQASLSKLLASL